MLRFIIYRCQISVIYKNLFAPLSEGIYYFSLYPNSIHGNLTKDSNKGIANISWNSLNLPNVVSFTDGSTVTYTYAADGTKLRTVHNINGTATQTEN